MTSTHDTSGGGLSGLNRAKFEQLYTTLERPLYNVVYRWLWDQEEAHDVVQEAFMRLWKMRDKVRPQTVEPLLYRIAVNLASNRRRSRKLRRWLTLDALRTRPSSDASADSKLSSAQEQRAVRKAVDALPEHLRRVVVMCEFSGLSYRAIGEILGIPEGTVASRRHTALKRLRTTMTSWRNAP
ncbi:MAG: sigma-70 family RNA polymerase sigma factor [Myxococcota bacterium]